MTEVTVEQVLAKLQQKPGRGGVKLSYAEAEFLLDLVQPPVEEIHEARRLVLGIKSAPEPRALTPSERKLLRLEIDTRRRALLRESSGREARKLGAAA